MSDSTATNRLGLGGHATDNPFHINAGDYRSGELQVILFSGAEEANASYLFSVLVWGEGVDDNTVETSVLGSRATLALEIPDGAPRFVHGIIAGVVAEGRNERRQHMFRLTLVPRLWLLNKRHNSRVFQDRRVHEIVDVILDEYGIERRWDLVGSYRSRDYCVQYQESDFDFITRIVAEEGVFFYFDQPAVGSGSAELLVFGDSPAAAYPPIDGKPQLVFRRQAADSVGSALVLDEDFVTDFRMHAHVESEAVVLRDYDFKRPLLDLTAQSLLEADQSVAQAPSAAVRSGALEEYHHHGDYEETDADVDHAKVFLEQLRAQAREAHGVSVCRRLLPGHRFELVEHDATSLDGSYVVSAVTHRGHAPLANPGSALANPGSELVYENRFRCVAVATPIRPSRPKRPLRQTLESGVVVGPAGEEIHTDVYGRIKVQFHWDRRGRHNDFNSCWIRVAHTSAGTGWGFQFIPRIGMEVLVGFLGGDQDRPVVVSCLFNAKNPPPYALPGDASRSGIRTQTTPGGGGSNEIAFEDAAGREQLYVHAQRNLDEEVGHDRSATIGGELRESIQRDKRSEVFGDRRDQTAGDYVATVSGAYRLVAEDSVSAEVRAATVATFGADVETKLGGHHRSTVAGNRVATVDGDEQRRTLGKAFQYVAGSHTSIVGGDAIATINGTLTVNASRGLSLGVGNARDPKSASASVSGDLVLSTGGVTELSVDKELRIRAGDSSLIITADSITLSSKKLILSADVISCAGEAAEMTLSEAVEISGKTVKIASADKAILALNKEATLDGPAVKIKPGAAAEKAARERRAQEAKTLERETITLYDRAGKRITNAPYEVSFFGYLDVGVAADGSVEVPKFPDVEKGTVRWGRPKDQRENPDDQQEYEFAMDVYLQFEDDDEDEVLRRKLHNLGYQGNSTAEAVYAYQLASGQQATGDVDDARGSVDERHGGQSPVEHTRRES